MTLTARTLAAAAAFLGILSTVACTAPTAGDDKTGTTSEAIQCQVGCETGGGSSGGSSSGGSGSSSGGTVKSFGPTFASAETCVAAAAGVGTSGYYYATSTSSVITPSELTSLGCATTGLLVEWECVDNYAGGGTYTTSSEVFACPVWQPSLPTAYPISDYPNVQRGVTSVTTSCGPATGWQFVTNDNPPGSCEGAPSPTSGRPT